MWATREEGTVYLWEKRIDKSFSVTTGKCQPSGPSLQRDTQQALFPTETLDPPVGIFLPTEFQWWSLFVHPSHPSKILFHVHAYGVVKSLCFLNCQGQNRSLYQCPRGINRFHIPMHMRSRNPCAFLWAVKSIPYWRPCEKSIVIYGIAHTRRWRHDVPNYYRMMSDF